MLILMKYRMRLALSLEDKISDLYGQQEAEAIFHGHDPEYIGKPAKPKSIEST